MFKELEKFKNQQLHNIKVTEIKINLPSGGFIAGKWWGDLDTKPILCLHGWQDNAGTFDRLIPLLPKDFSYLAIDFLGHGRSCWLPDGVVYNVFDNIFAVLYVMKEYKWDKISLLGHSMGAMVSFLFASIFPEKMDLLIKIDSFKNLDRTYEQELSDVKDGILNFMVIDERIRSSSEPPSYTVEEMIERVNTGSFFNITTESAPYLLDRNITRSSKYPDKFYFSRDPRLKNIILMTHPESTAIESAKRINIPFLFFTTKQSSPLYAKFKYFDNLIKTFQQNPKFKLEVIDSDSHYFHLNDPEMISNAIGRFLIENRKVIHHL
ncbi:unnamed protein product [Chironomus riparius]|uniref:AB hydrolase-1 domain-containing protein n=1 Tax=Chironomus riparius TaxID=315576 RepID=A0A9N9S007_9DIPT|nr:unnamed protein product [Chironomus riparius]